jgi:hypothetical protein
MFDNNNIWLRLSSIKFGEGISTQFGMIIPQTTMKNIATKLGQKLRNNSVKKLVNYIAYSKQKYISDVPSIFQGKSN